MGGSYDVVLAEEDLVFLYEATIDGCCARRDSADAQDIDVLALRARDLMHAMGHLILDERYSDFADFVAAHRLMLAEEAFCDEDVARLLHLGYSQGLAQRNGRCAIGLGQLYEQGDILPKDSERASELYGLATAWA